MLKINKNHKKVSLNAPRFFLKSIRCLGDSNFVNKFIKKHPKFADKINARKMTEIIDTFNKNVRNAVVDNRFGVELPERLGLIVMKSFPSDIGLINEKYYYTTGKIVPFSSPSTESMVVKICYENDSYRYNLTNKTLWYFEPCRKFKKEAAIAFVSDWRKYQMISKADREISKRERKIKVLKNVEYGLNKFLETYDEFAF